MSIDMFGSHGWKLKPVETLVLERRCGMHNIFQILENLLHGRFPLHCCRQLPSFQTEINKKQTLMS